MYKIENLKKSSVITKSRKMATITVRVGGDTQCIPVTTGGPEVSILLNGDWVPALPDQKTLINFAKNLNEENQKDGKAQSPDGILVEAVNDSRGMPWTARAGARFVRFTDPQVLMYFITNNDGTRVHDVRVA